MEANHQDLIFAPRRPPLSSEAQLEVELGRSLYHRLIHQKAASKNELRLAKMGLRDVDINLLVSLDVFQALMLRERDNFLPVDLSSSQ